MSLHLISLQFYVCIGPSDCAQWRLSNDCLSIHRENVNSIVRLQLCTVYLCVHVCTYVRTSFTHVRTFSWSHIVCTVCTVTLFICHTHTPGLMYSLYSHLIHLSLTYTWVYVQFVQSRAFVICHTCTLGFIYSLYSHLRHLSHMYTCSYVQFIH